MEMPRAKKAMTTEYVQLSGYIPVRRAVKAARHDPVCEKHRNSSKAGERPGLPQMKGCSLQAMKAHSVTMVLPAVGRHETRTGEMPMELITVSHPDSSLLGGRGSNKAKTYFAVDTATGGEDYDDVLRGISDQASHALLQGRQFDISFVQDYGKARERLCMEVIPVKGNEEVLSGIPHTVMEDLAVVYRIDLNDNASVTVTDEMLDSFGITEEQLHADAMENAPKTRPASLKTMMETLGIPQEFADPSAPVLYVATTIEQIRGAGVIAYPGFLQEAAEKLGGDFFILPSSVHEVLFLPKTGNQDFREMETIVREINSTQVAPQDRLSDNVYHYDSRDRVFELAESYEKRMAARESEKTQDGPSMLEKLREKKAEAAVQPRKPIQVKGKEAMAL